MLAVDWFPFCVFVVQIALFPTALMDPLDACFRKKEGGEEKKNEGDTPLGITYTDLPTVSSVLPTYTDALFVRYFAQGFLASCVFTVVFCGVREAHNHRGESGRTMPFVSGKWDASVGHFGSYFSLATGWSAGTPPPTGMFVFVKILFLFVHTIYNFFFLNFT